MSDGKIYEEKRLFSNIKDAQKLQKKERVIQVRIHKRTMKELEEKHQQTIANNKAEQIKIEERKKESISYYQKQYQKACIA